MVRSLRIGVTAAAVLLAVSACGSSSPKVSTGAPSMIDSPTPTATATDTGGSGTSNGSGDFCTAFDSTDMAALAQSKNPQDVMKAWDKATADAPSEIHADMKVIDDYLHAVLNHDVQGMQTTSQQLSQAATHLGVYAAQHCNKN